MINRVENDRMDATRSSASTAANDKPAKPVVNKTPSDVEISSSDARYVNESECKG